MIDVTALAELTDGDTELASAILADYVDSSGPDVSALRAALGDQRRDDVRHLAHRIKGASMAVGARHVTALAEALEAAASTTAVGWDALQATAGELEDAMSRVARAITRLAATP